MAVPSLWSIPRHVASRGGGVRAYDAETSSGVLDLDLERLYLTEEDCLASCVVSGDSSHFHEIADFQSTLHRDRQVWIGELDLA